MDLDRVVAQLRSELESLDAAILSLERLQRREGRRGRPPSWLAALRKQGGPRRKKNRGGDHREGNPESPEE